MAKVVLKNVGKRFTDDRYVVKDFSLEIENRDFIVFVGPSGSGKSTTLRMIAGLEKMTEGEIYIDGELINKVESKDRDIAMVFQNYALYPHMNVYDNMAFPLKQRRVPKPEIHRVVTETAKTLGLERLLKRKPKALSGGERQRVAMGRAIVRNPKVFLMDEPLSNLDSKFRVQMRAELAKLYNKLGATIIYVTHDQTEAMTLGTRIVVLNHGEIQQIDTPSNLYKKPKNRFVAGFIGSPQMNFIDGKIVETGGKWFFETEELRWLVPESKRKAAMAYRDRKVMAGIRPENINLVEGPSDTIAKITVKELLGAETYLYTETANLKLIVRTGPDVDLVVGDQAKLSFDLEKLHLFDLESGQAID